MVVDFPGFLEENLEKYWVLTATEAEMFAVQLILKRIHIF